MCAFLMSVLLLSYSLFFTYYRELSLAEKIFYLHFEYFFKMFFIRLRIVFKSKMVSDSLLGFF